MELAIASENDGVVQVNVTGEIRQRKLPSNDKEPIGELLGEGGYAKKVLLDFSGVTYVDSSGLGWLIVVQKRFKEAGGCMVMHSVPQLVTNVLKIVKLDQVFAIADDAAAATSMANS